MKKVVIYIFLVLNVISFSDSFNENEDERTILKQEHRFEQERLQKEFQKREENFNQLKLEKTEKQDSAVNEIKFHISQINLEDEENLLNEIEKENILEKYLNRDLGSTEITNLVSDLTNRLIAKGYIAFPEDNTVEIKGKKFDLTGMRRHVEWMFGRPIPRAEEETSNEEKEEENK